MRDRVDAIIEQWARERPDLRRVRRGIAPTRKRRVQREFQAVLVPQHGGKIAQLAEARQLAMVSFGSCSFREPLDDLAALGML